MKLLLIVLSLFVLGLILIIALYRSVSTWWLRRSKFQGDLNEARDLAKIFLSVNFCVLFSLALYGYTGFEEHIWVSLFALSSHIIEGLFALVYWLLGFGFSIGALILCDELLFEINVKNE